MTQELKEGWKSLINSPKFHYFREGRSLCGRWATFGGGYQKDDGSDHPGDCKACRSKLKKEKKI